MPRPLDIEYGDHTPVRELVDVIEFCAGTIGLESDRGDGSHVHGPELYFAVVSGGRGYADVLGESQWPATDSRHVLAGVFAFSESAKGSPSPGTAQSAAASTGPSPRWSGSETPPTGCPTRSTRSGWGRVTRARSTRRPGGFGATVTLSAENGRVTTFHGGEFVTRLRGEMSRKW